MVGLDHPLAGREQVSLQELIALPAVLPGTTTYTRGSSKGGAHRRHRTACGMATNYLETLHMLVATGLAGACCRRPCWTTRCMNAVDGSP